VKQIAELFNEPDSWSQLDGDHTVVDCPPKRPIFTQGEPADSLYYIQKGRVKLSLVSRRGKAGAIGLFGQGDFLGEDCLVGNLRRIATATPLEETRILRIERATAETILHSDRAFAEKFLAYLLLRNIRTQEDLIDQFFNGSEKRLARILLLLANYGKEQTGDVVIGRISHETLAEMIGTTRSRVSFFMNRFRKLGYIDYNGAIEIHHSLMGFVLSD
jgi:CRP/FNR family transcriptional regulator, cyclic AMP receptor protein